MPSFFGIPLKLSITGMTFDGVAILASIKKRAHFCFLSPEDAEALIGAEDGTNDEPGGRARAGEENFRGRVCLSKLLDVPSITKPHYLPPRLVDHRCTCKEPRFRLA